MKREYIFLILGLVLIWILGYFLFIPSKEPKSGISQEATSTSINK
jgi:predicted permease